MSQLPDVIAMEKPTGEECQVCRKRSDAAVKVHGIVLCGTHADEYTFSGETIVHFVKVRREGKYKACWEAKL